MVSCTRWSRWELEDPKFKTKRTLTLILFSLRVFLDGIEFSIIAPSVWLYLKRFNAQPWFLGVTMSIYGLTGVVVMPFIGRLYDMTKRGKYIMYALNMCEISGCILYSVPYSKWCILGGRAISGIGAGSQALIDGEIAWMFPPESRAKAYAIKAMSRYVGFFFGPLLSYVLLNVNIWLGGWHIDFTNSPGLLSAILWLCLQILTFIMHYDMAYEYQKMQLLKAEVSHEDYLITKQLNDGSTEQGPLLKLDTAKDRQRENRSDFRSAMTELASLDIFAVNLVPFLLQLGIMTYVSLIRLITQEDLGWNAVSLSIVYVSTAVALSSMILVIGFTAKKLGEVQWLFVGVTATAIAAVLIYVYHEIRRYHVTALTVSLIGLSLSCLGSATAVVCSRTLMSKLISVSNQGLAQGLSSMIRRTGYSLGLFVGSAGFENLIILSFVLLETLLLSGALLFGVLKLLIKREQNVAKSEIIAGEEREV